MILFYGYLDYAPLLRAIEAAREREADHGVIDQRHSDRYDFVLKTGDAGVDGYLRIAGAVSDRAYALESGHIRFAGTMRAFADDAKAREELLGLA